MTRLSHSTCRTLGSFCWLLLVWGALEFSRPACCQAQENGAVRPSTPATPKPAARHIYVPVEDLDALLERDKRGVLLSRDDFRTLSDAARKNALATPDVPEGIVLARGTYLGKIAGDQLLISAEFELNQFANGWRSLRLPLKDLAVESARLDGQPARLGRCQTDDGALEVFSDRDGRHKLVLELCANLGASGSDRFVSFALPPAPAATMKVEVPAEKYLRLDGLSLERPAGHELPATYELAVGGKRDVSLSMTDKTARQNADGLLFATTAVGVHAAPDVLTWQAVTTVQVFGQSIDRLKFTVPSSLEIVSVSSPGLESWDLGRGDANQQETELNLVYRQSFQEARKITFQGIVSKQMEGNWEIPALRLATAASHTSRIRITRPAGVRVSVLDAEGVRRIAAEPAPPLAATRTNRAPAPSPHDGSTGEETLDFAAWRQDFRLVIATETKAREIQAAIATLLDINSRGLDLTVSLTVQCRFASLFEVGLAVPAEWSITQVGSADRTVEWQIVPEEAGVHQIRIPLDPPLPAGGQIPLTIRAHRDLENWPVEETLVSFELPEVKLLQAGVVEGTYLIGAENGLEVVPTELKGLDPARVGTAQPNQLGYEYQDTHFSGQLSVTRKPARISGATLTFCRLDRETQSTHLEGALEIEGGGIRKLELALPESAGKDLRFRLGKGAVRIVEQVAAEPVDGARRWTLQFDQRATGSLRIATEIETARGELQEFSVPLLRVPAAEQETGYVALEAGPDQQLSISATDAEGIALSEVDPADLPAATGYAPRERIVSAYKFVLPGSKIVVKEARFEQIAVPTAVGDQLAVTSVLGETGEFQHQAVIRFRAIGVQGLRVSLPKGAQLWGALIDGTPVEVRVADSAFLIPLPLSNDPTANRTLQLFYRTEIDRMGASGRIQQAPPQLAVINGAGNVQPIEILEQHWKLFHPGEVELVASTAAFEPDAPFRLSGFLGALRRVSANHTRSELGRKAIAILLAAAAIAVLLVAYRRRGIVGFSGVLFCLLVGGSYLLVSRSTRNLESLSSASNMEHYGRVAGDAAADPVMRAESGNRTEFQKYGTIVGLSDPRNPASGSTEAEEAAIPFFGPSNPKVSPQAGKVGAPMHLSANAGGGAGGQKGLGGAQGARGGGGFGGQNGFGGGKEAAESTARVDNLAMDGRRRELAFQAEPNAPNRAGGGPGAAPAPPPPDAMPAPAADAVGKRVAGRGDEKAAATPQRAGGLLSLVLDLQASPGDRYSDFSYRGDNGAGLPQLDVRYRNRERMGFATICVELAVLLGFWLSRRRAPVQRTALAACCLAIPIGLMPVVSSGWLPILDGLLFGGLVGLGLWLVVAIVKCANSKCARTEPVAVKLTTPLVMIAALSATIGALCETARAEEKKPAPASATVAAPHNDDSLVIPYDPASNPIDAARIFVPYDKFVELWNQAHPDRMLGASTPADGLVAEALYSAELRAGKPNGKPSVVVKGRLTLFSFRQEQISLRLPLGRVALESARLDGQPAPLSAESEGRAPSPHVLLSAPGMHVLDLEFSPPAERNGPTGSFTLPLASVPAGSLSFTLPDPDASVRVNGTSSAYRKTKQGDRALITLPIDRGGNITLSWQPAQSRTAVEGIVQAESRSVLFLEDAGVRWSVDYSFKVRQGSLSEVVFSLPAGVAVRQVSGQDVGGWSIEGKDADRTLRLLLRRKVEDETRVTCELVLLQKLEDSETTFALPEFAPRQTTRDSGTVALFAEPQFALRATNHTGLSQRDAKSFSGAAATSLVPPGATPELVYHYAARPYRLEFIVTRRKPRMTAVAEHRVAIAPRKMFIASHWQVDLVGAPRSEIPFQLPPGFLVQYVVGEAIADWHVSGHDADDPTSGSALHVELKAPMTGALSISLVGKIPREPLDESAQIDLPIPWEVDELKTQAAVSLDPVYVGTIGKAKSWKSLDPAQLDTRLRGKGTQDIQFAFGTSSTSPDAIEISLSPAAPRMNASAFTILTAADASIDYTLTLQWSINLAGSDSFVFTTPRWLAGRLNFPDLGGPRIRQVSQEDAGEKTHWTIRLEDPQRERYLVIAQARLPLPRDGQFRGPGIVFEQALPGQDLAQFAPLETQSQYVMLINQSQSPLISQTPGAVEPVTSEDLAKFVKVRQDLLDQATEIVRVKAANAEVSWKQQKLQAERLLPASVNLADITTVLAVDGTWRSQASYRIRNRSRQFLALQMPPESTISSLFVKELAARPVVTVRNGKTLTLIPLPKTTEGDLAFEVKLVYGGKLPGGALPRGFAFGGRSIDLPTPDVLTISEDAEFGMPVSQTTWTVFLPRNMQVELIQDPKRTNVSAVTATVQYFDQAGAFLSEASELVNLGATSSSSRVKSRAMGNLKQLKDAIDRFGNSSEFGYPQSQEESTRQQDIQQRAQKLSKAIQDVEAKDATDRKKNNGAPRADQPAPSLLSLGFQGAGEQQRLNELFSDNRVQVPGHGDTGMTISGNGVSDFAEWGLREFQTSPQEKESLDANSNISRSQLRSQVTSQAAALNTVGNSDSGESAADDSKSKQVQPARKRRVAPPTNGKDEAATQKPAADKKSKGEAEPDQVDRDGDDPLGEVNVDQDKVNKGLGKNGGAPGSPEVRASTGGLSLPIAIPTDGQKLTFSKLSGGAKVAMSLKPQEATRAWLAWLWVAVWLALGIAFVIGVHRNPGRIGLPRNLSVALVVLGLAWFFLLPIQSAVGWLGFLAFLVGAMAIGVRTIRQGQSPQGA